MKTTQTQRSDARLIAKRGLQRALDSEWLCNLFDDFATIEAELAALQRVQREDLNVAHEPGYGWSVFQRRPVVGDGCGTYHAQPLGQGNTLATALAEYDAKQEQVR